MPETKEEKIEKRKEDYKESNDSLAIVGQEKKLKRIGKTTEL